MVFFVLRTLVTIVMSTSLNLSLVEGKVPPSCSEDAYIHHVIDECQSKEVNGSHVHLTSKLLSRASFCLSSCRKLPSFKICQVTETNDGVTTASVVTKHTGTTALKEITPTNTITATDKAYTTPTVETAPEATRIVTIEAKVTQKGTTESESTRKLTTEVETTRQETKKTDRTRMVSTGAGTTQMATTKPVTTRLVTTKTESTRMESMKSDTTKTKTTATETSNVTTGATTELTTETKPMLTTTVAEATALSTTVSTTPFVTTTSMITTRKQTTTKEVETTSSTSTSVSPTTESPQPELLIPSCDLESWNSALTNCAQPAMGRRLIVPFNRTFILHIIDVVNDRCGTNDHIWLDCERNVKYGDMECRDPTTSGPYDRNAWVKISDLYGGSPDWRDATNLNVQGCLAVKMENGKEKFFSNSCNSISATTVCMLPS